MKTPKIKDFSDFGEFYVSNGYFEKKSHIFTTVFNKFQGDYLLLIWAEYDCDKNDFSKYIYYKLPGFASCKLLGNEKYSFVLFKLNLQTPVPNTQLLSYLGYCDLNKSGNIKIITDDDLGINFSENHYFTSDFSYFATDSSIIELTGDDSQFKIMNLKHSNAILSLDQLTQSCIGWNKNETLVAFEGIENAGKGTIYIGKVPENIEGRASRISVYNIRGKNIFNYDNDYKENIGYISWLDSSDIFFYDIDKKQIYSIDIENGNKRLLIDNIDFI